jgi:hypothetical protein
VPPLAVEAEGSGSPSTSSNSGAAAAYAENGPDAGDAGGQPPRSAAPAPDASADTAPPAAAGSTPAPRQAQRPAQPAAAPATDPLSGRPATRWMSASVTQPDAMSFTPEAEDAPQGGAVAERAAALAAQLGARVDYLLSSMKAAKQSPASQAIEQQPSPALRYATAAYIEF